MKHKHITISILGLIIMTSLVMPASLVHAEEDIKPEPKKEANPSFLDRIIADELSRVQGTSTPAQTPVAASTTPAATTTPVLPPPEDRTNTTPGDDINKEAEEVLNTNLKPETPAPAKPVKPSPTPVASTTPAGTTDPVEPTIDGSSNSFSPNNYYIPLDNLSPEMTYALSFVAMILGISGAVLIIRDPRTKTAPAPAGSREWVPAPAGFTQKPLLEP